jgi:hypothetical protein
MMEFSPHEVINVRSRFDKVPSRPSLLPWRVSPWAGADIIITWCDKDVHVKKHKKKHRHRGSESPSLAVRHLAPCAVRLAPCGPPTRRNEMC